MTISEATKQLFKDHKENAGTFSLATASKDGVPNVVPIGFLWVANDDEVWVLDNFLNKTLANIRENPVAAVYAVGGPSKKEAVQLKGKCIYETTGADYESAKQMAHKINPGFPAKGLVKIKISDTFDTTPGPDAGKKI